MTLGPPGRRVAVHDCPMKLLTEPDHIISAIWRTHSDRKAGACGDWPHELNAAVVDGVRLVEAIAADVRFEADMKHDRDRAQSDLRARNKAAVQCR